MNQPIIASTPVLYSDLTGRVPSTDELNELIAPFKKQATFRMLCMLNTLLSFYAHDVSNSIKVQGFLFTNFLGDELFEKTKEKFGRDSMMERPVFHRQQLLAVMKEVLLQAREDGEKDPNPPENVKDRYALGEGCLIMNDLQFPEEQLEKLKNKGGESEKERIHAELFAQWLPTSELLNTPDVRHSILRNLDYARIFDERFSQFTFSAGQTLSQRFQELTGIDLKRYLAMVFNFHLFYQSQSESLEKLIDNTALFNVDTTSVFAKMKLTKAEVRAFFELTATDIAALVEEFENPESTKHDVLPQYDFRPFRRHPFVFINEERTVVTCIDPAFLAEKIATGAYHTILKSLEIENATEREKSDRKKFLRGYWGDVFQIYVNDRIREAFPVENHSFYNSPKWNSPKVRANQEAFDGVLDSGDALVVFEEKGKYLEYSAKYSGDQAVLLEDLHERFGKGVVQLAKNLEVLFSNDPNQTKHTFSQRDEKDQPVFDYSIEAASKVKRVYPVLIVQDFSLKLGFANRELRNRFSEEIESRNIDPGLIKPLSLMTVENLEKLLPYLGEVSLRRFLTNTLSRMTRSSVLVIFLSSIGREGESRTNQTIGSRSDSRNFASPRKNYSRFLIDLIVTGLIPSNFCGC